MEATTDNCKEAVLFNSDALLKIISHLSSIDLLNLALTNTKFGIHQEGGLSLIKMSTDILVHEIATEEQLAALPRYDGENALADYHYLQLLRAPLTFDQLVGAPMISGDKTCVMYSASYEYEYEEDCETAFSNNILRAGKHYVTFGVNTSTLEPLALMGVMRPGHANQYASGSPLDKKFYQNFSQKHGEGSNNNNIQCCLYNTANGRCYHTINWPNSMSWDGKERISSGDEIGMLLDLDDGTLSVYKNGRKLGVMKKGLVGPYCWVVSVNEGTLVTIKRGTIPP